MYFDEREESRDPTTSVVVLEKRSSGRYALTKGHHWALATVSLHT